MQIKEFSPYSISIEKYQGLGA